MQWYLKALREYATFDGRARRTEFWMFVLAYALIYIGLVLVDTVIAVAVGTPIFVLSGLFGLAMLIPGIAVTVRRLHDTSRSGWWVLLHFIPLVGPIVLLVFLVEDSTPMPNAYGPNPKMAVPGYQTPSVPA